MNIKKIITIVIICIIVIILAVIGILLIITNNKRNNKTDITETENFSISNDSTRQIIEVTDIKKVYSIEKLINNVLNTAYSVQKNQGEYTEEEDGLDIRKKYAELLNDLNINDIQRNFYITNVYKMEINENYSVYFAKGDLIYKEIYNQDENISKKTVAFSIIKNKEDENCQVEIYGKNYKNIFEYSSDIEKTTISKENAQSFRIVNEIEAYSEILDAEVSDEDIAFWYYNNYKINALYFSEDAYNILDEEYRKIRFEDNIDNYKEYLQKNKNIIKESALTQYAVTEMQGYILYTLADTKNNTYFIKVTDSPMEYKIFLDSYTIPYEGYSEKYNNMKDTEKAAANMLMFINMINTKDYKHAYEVLDEEFKSNNFETIDEFINYVNNNLYENNIVSESDVTETDKYFEGIIKLRNKSGSDSQEKTLNIVMKLKENMDFVMSFSIE